MKKLLFLLIIIALFSCYDNSIVQTTPKKKDKKTTETESIEEIEKAEKDKKISKTEYVLLFFRRDQIFKKKPTPTPVITIKTDVFTPTISARDYKVIVDWQVEGGRKIKLKNVRTGKEHIIIEGDTTGEIILVERNIHFYKFKIENTIIKIER